MLSDKTEYSRVREVSSDVAQNVLIWKWLWPILYNKLVAVGTCSLLHTTIIQMNLHLSELAKDKFMCTLGCHASLRIFFCNVFSTYKSTNCTASLVNEGCKAHPIGPRKVSKCWLKVSCTFSLFGAQSNLISIKF